MTWKRSGLPPHPSYGYLTKDEFERAKKASAGEAKYYKELADRRKKSTKGKRE